MLAQNLTNRLIVAALAFLACFSSFSVLRAESKWEITSDSQLSLDRGLEHLAKTQNSDGNWGTKDLGVVSMGVLAFMADGHAPGRGKYGSVLERSLDYVLTNAKPSGLLNINGEGRDMYNHGLATFVLGQAYGNALNTVGNVDTFNVNMLETRRNSALNNNASLQGSYMNAQAQQAAGDKAMWGSIGGGGLAAGGMIAGAAIIV